MLGRRGSRHLVVSLSEKLLQQHAIPVLGRPLPMRHTANRYTLAGPDNRSRYVNGSLRLLEEISKRPALLDNRSTMSEIETQLAESLLLAVSTEPRLHSAPHRHQIARRAYGYMQDRLGDVASVAELCGATGGNYATLERGFRELYGLTPQAYLHAARLLRARRDLQQPQPATTVTGVAIRWGFYELGRFSVQYRLRFGESPSETVRRVRGY
jgi:AraC-like DNA-binding protein